MQLQTQNPALKIVVPLVNAKRKAQFTEILNATAPTLKISLLDGQSKQAMQAADAILFSVGLLLRLRACCIKSPW